MVKLSEVEPFSGMLPATNALMMTGGATTVMLAFEVLPVPPSVEVTWTLLFFTPAVVPCTFTETVHEALAASVPPDKLTEPEPATAVAVPPQVLLRLLGVATTSPAGRLSVKAIPLSATVVFGLLMVKVSDVVPFSAIVDGLNTLAIEGGASTFTLADAVPPTPPSFEFTLPVVLFWRPAAVPVTLTAKVQEVLCARLAPDRLITLVFCVAVMVPPPHLPD